MNYSFDYEVVYQNITSKLKKRIFKKPNYAEASDSLNTLIKLVSEEECPEYAGVFYISKARCESTSKNVLEEASNLVIAGENFFKAEKKLKDMRVVSIEDFLETGTMCFMYSIHLCIEAKHFYLALSSGLRLISVLREFRNYNDAINVYNLLLSIANLDLVQYLMLMLGKGLCLIKTRNFKAALKSYVEIIEKLKINIGANVTFGRYRDILEEAEIFRVLLVLLCQSHDPKGDNESLSLTDYCLANTGGPGAGDAPTPTSTSLKLIDEDLFCHCVSLIIAVHHQTHRAAEHAAIDLQNHFSDDQNDLVREIINELINPSGEAF